ncbi:AzlD domain-containing protein [Brevibacterium litoralis]|uniref:AzlD domain-containing protein n=1 Tax=Brevibacterium litoralis TaxID=3138935 RepID=UPI0032EB05AA
MTDLLTGAEATSTAIAIGPTIPIWPLLISVLLLGVLNFVYKSAGPVLLGGRELPPRLTRAIDGMGQGLLAALVMNVLIGHRGTSFDLTLAPGVVVAVVLRWMRVNDLVCILVAVLLTAGTRAVLG